MLGSLGAFLAPLFKPLGFGTWQAAVALLTGLVAKEAIVSSLSMFYGFALTASSAAVAGAMAAFTPLSAFSFLVFILLYICLLYTSRVFMAVLRKKIEKNPAAPELIQTHIGIGYRMMRIPPQNSEE